jgi:hypothetical protein
MLGISSHEMLHQHDLRCCRADRHPRVVASGPWLGACCVDTPAPGDDDATSEMAQESGEENFFLFGLTAERVANSRSSI